ncbi:MAG: GIY-YIG nuclease family protein [Xenococcaceae cyanobacterium MO_188.B29]|nr:GIY-YIG nuclease family protein [Xenococcaceae cyanobacterium MO_188.B29]
MKTIGVSYARAWRYQKPTLIEKNIKLGKMYYFNGGSAYLHDPQKSVRLNYRNKVFFLIGEEQEIKISVYPLSITNKKVIEWVKTWASKEDKIITPGGNKISLDKQNIISTKEFIYFILNPDSNAVKIGRTKNIAKRLNSLQVANPVELRLLKTVQVNSGKEAKKTEELFHNKFANLRLLGEWFRFEQKLQEFIEQL